MLYHVIGLLLTHVKNTPSSWEQAMINRFIHKIMDLTSKCSVCTKNVQQVGAHIKCIDCKHLNHLNCVRLTRDEAANARNWYCPKCVQFNLPLNHHNDDMGFRQAMI